VADDFDTRLTGLPLRAMRQLRAVRQAIDARRGAEAEQLLARAQPLAGGHPEFQRLAGACLILQKRADDAMRALKRAHEMRPQDALTLIDLGAAMLAGGDAEQAREAFRRAIDRDPAQIGARIGLADALNLSGETVEAAREYRGAIARAPRHVDAWAGLANLRSIAIEPQELVQLQALIDDASLDDESRAKAGFALARVLDAHERYAEAFAALGTANAIKRRTIAWDATKFSQHITAISHAFRAPLATTADSDQGREVIFIVSLPRSGSTLTEQILASHRDVEGANELWDLHAVLEEESVRRKQAFPLWCEHADPADWQRLGRRYLERTARWRQMRPRFTDKALANWRYLGAIAAMLPGARIVHCRRDPLETCFACYRTPFSHGQAFTYDIAELAAYWREYEGLVRIWHARYPGRIFDQVYEDLIAQPEMQIRRLLDACDLSFDEACLRFHETARGVRTLSAAQVREPLRRDTARAAPYGELLSSLRDALGMLG